MKRILMSLLTVGAVGGLAFGATSAFFSDTETSTGNTVTAGQLDLKVDSTAHYAGMVCDDPTTPGVYVWVDEDADPTNNPRPELLGQICTGTWVSGDLGPESQFFNLSDVKPGDTGENTLSLTVIDNDAWACVVIDNLQNNDNACTEPESNPLEGNDLTCGNPGVGQGELAQNLYFTSWLDQGNVPGWQNSDENTGDDDSGEGDNIWQGQESEPLLFSNQQGPASDVLNGQVYALADSSNSNFLAGAVTNYIGLQWCAGTMTNDGSTISCNGATMGNDTQTDSLTADVSIYVEQRRNNPTFTCAGANLLGEVSP